MGMVFAPHEKEHLPEWVFSAPGTSHPRSTCFHFEVFSPTTVRGVRGSRPPPTRRSPAGWIKRGTLVAAAAVLSGFSQLILVALALSIPLRPPARQAALWPHAAHLGKSSPRPLCARECVAFQLSVLFDIVGDARPPEWVVQETRGTDFEVDSERIRGDRVLVTTPLKPVEAEVAQAAGLDLTRFLRERGLFSYDGSFDLFEACQG